MYLMADVIYGVPVADVQLDSMSLNEIFEELNENFGDFVHSDYSGSGHSAKSIGIEAGSWDECADYIKHSDFNYKETSELVDTFKKRCHEVCEYIKKEFPEKPEYLEEFQILVATHPISFYHIFSTS